MSNEIQKGTMQQIEAVAKTANGSSSTFKDMTVESTDVTKITVTVDSAGVFRLVVQPEANPNDNVQINASINASMGMNPRILTANLIVTITEGIPANEATSFILQFKGQPEPQV